MLQTFLSDGRMREFLTQARTIAVVGAKDKEGQPVDRVGKYLIQAGYQAIPAFPAIEAASGLTMPCCIQNSWGRGESATVSRA